jgi:hypothetical protein
MWSYLLCGAVAGIFAGAIGYWFGLKQGLLETWEFSKHTFEAGKKAGYKEFLDKATLAVQDIDREDLAL